MWSFKIIIQIDVLWHIFSRTPNRTATYDDYDKKNFLSLSFAHNKVKSFLKKHSDFFATFNKSFYKWLHTEVYVSWKFVGIKWKFDSTNIIIKLCKKKADRPIDLYSLWAIDSLSHYHYFLLKYLLARMFFSNNNLLCTNSELPNKRAYLFSFFGILIHIKQMTKSYTLLLFFME